MKIHIHIQHAYVVILKEIVQRWFYTNRISYIILIFDPQLFLPSLQRTVQHIAQSIQIESAGKTE